MVGHLCSVQLTSQNAAQMPYSQSESVVAFCIRAQVSLRRGFSRRSGYSDRLSDSHWGGDSSADIQRAEDFGNSGSQTASDNTEILV